MRVVGLLLEDGERRDDVQAGVDHGRELPREDLEVARLDLPLERLGATAGGQARSWRSRLHSGAHLVEVLGQQALDRELLAGGSGGRSLHFAVDSRPAALIAE